MLHGVDSGKNVFVWESTVTSKDVGASGSSGEGAYSLEQNRFDKKQNQKKDMTKDSVAVLKIMSMGMISGFSSSKTVSEGRIVGIGK